MPVARRKIVGIAYVECSRTISVIGIQEHRTWKRVSSPENMGNLIWLFMYNLIN